MKTIRGKITVFIVVCLVFVGILHVVYYDIIFNLQKKIELIQNFDDFRDNILEMRRSEKNFVYFKDVENLNKTIFYLFKTEDFCQMLAEDIVRVLGRDKYLRFKKTMEHYKAIMEANTELMKTGKGKINLKMIRSEGKEMVDFANELIETKRLRIQKAIHKVMTIPIIFLILFIVFIFFIFRLIAKGILKPLSLIQKATEEAAKGTFEPIVYESDSKDEIFHLIETFNEMEKQLDTKQEQLLQSRKMASIGTFTSGIAHELNNPLNNISLTAESLMEEHSQMSKEEAEEMMQEIITQADRASLVVKNLLEFSRTERPLLLELNVNEVIEQTVKLVRNQIMVTGIQLERDITEDLPPIKGRRQDLQGVFLNILINSIQAIEDLSKESVITIHSGPGPEGYIRIDFSDTGKGIKPDDLKHIFDPFYTTKAVGRGTGLGLSLVYGIIRTHGGYIEVKSKIGKGTTFSIYLPIAKNNEKEDNNNV